ncbi:MAG: peptidyl-prolyl cis-trans isomerase [Candidatus Omnitrophica bacterium]|nr:peptidyl-prolyl cis-trans isomerase [Candidatus Omnitrophota bacterium]
MRKLIVFILLAGFILSYPLSAQDRIIAIVDKEVITQADLDNFYNFIRMQSISGYEEDVFEDKMQLMKKELLERLIEEKLILREANKENIQIDENRIRARIEQIKRGFSSDLEFQHALTNQGLTQADIEKRIKEQFLIANLIETKIKNKIMVKPSEVTEFYQKNKDNLIEPEKREFMYIKVKDENVAKELYAELNKGLDFTELVKNYSLNIEQLSVSKDRELKKELEDILFNLNLGQVSFPIKVEDNFYIFKLYNIIPYRHKSLSEAQDEIYAFLFEEKIHKEITRWLDELKKKAYIKIFSD